MFYLIKDIEGIEWFINEDYMIYMEKMSSGLYTIKMMEETFIVIDEKQYKEIYKHINSYIIPHHEVYEGF